MKTFLTIAFTVCILAAKPAFSENNEKKIVVLGSSVAAGWVTSYQEKFDMQNGYAARLARELNQSGWDVVNKSVPGNNTKDAIARFENEVLPEKPAYVLVGLSMSNEGLETENPDSVSASFETGIKKLIELCKINEIQVVLGLCYSNDNYTPLQYEYLKKMNLKMNNWGVPCINLLGALDDGNGHFPEGLTFDPNHPDEIGHEEFFLAFPDVFAALENGKAVPEYLVTDTSIKLGKKEDLELLSYVPSKLMHSFSFGFSLKTKSKGDVAAIISDDGSNSLMIDNDGYLVLNSIKSKKKIADRNWHQIFITHNYLSQKACLFVDGEKEGEFQEQTEVLQFVLGENPKSAAYKNLMIFRGALNSDEINAINNGELFHASLEVYSLLNEQELTNNSKVENLALSLNYAVVEPNDAAGQIAVLRKQIESAGIERENAKKFEYKKAILIDQAIYDQYVGKYEIAPGDYFVIEKSEGKLFFVDRGNKAEIHPESETKFFIRYPADLTVTFELDENKKVSGLIFGMNGREMKAKRYN